MTLFRLFLFPKCLCPSCLNHYPLESFAAFNRPCLPNISSASLCWAASCPGLCEAVPRASPSSLSQQDSCLPPCYNRFYEKLLLRSMYNSPPTWIRHFSWSETMGCYDTLRTEGHGNFKADLYLLFFYIRKVKWKPDWKSYLSFCLLAYLLKNTQSYFTWKGLSFGQEFSVYFLLVTWFWPLFIWSIFSFKSKKQYDTNN